MPLDKTPWTDDTPYPWGEHQGTPMKDMPVQHLVWLLEQRWIKDWPGLYAYLETRREQLIEDNKADPMAPQPSDSTTYDDFLKDFRGF